MLVIFSIDVFETEDSKDERNFIKDNNFREDLKYAPSPPTTSHNISGPPTMNPKCNESDQRLEQIMQEALNLLSTYNYSNRQRQQHTKSLVKSDKICILILPGEATARDS